MRCRRAIEGLLAAAALGWFSPGCQGGPADVPTSEVVLPIVGGNLAKTCAWPTAIMLVGPVGCSGTLVHPRVVTTAKHCLVTDDGTLRPPTSIGLGETKAQWAKTVDVSLCYVHPDNDFGICVLKQDVTDIPIVPVMAPCEMTELATGKPIVEAGFGVTSTTMQTYGTKKWINGTINSALPGHVNFDVTTGSQDGEYYGDSGGPLFFQMPDSTWRVIGEDCCSPAIVGSSTAPRVSTYTSVPYHVAWAEAVSGIDLTPCHDANGWNPTAACTGLPINPGDGVGTWSTLCAGEGMLAQQTCHASSSDGGTPAVPVDASRDGSPDGSVDGHPGDSAASDGEGGIDGDSDTGGTDGGDDSARIRDSGGLADRAANREAGADAAAPRPDSAASSDSGASAGAGGNRADAGVSDSDGSAVAGGSESDGNPGAGGNRADAGDHESDGSVGGGATDAGVSESDGSASSNADGARDGAAAGAGGTDGAGGISGWDGGSDAAAPSAGDGPSGSMVDSGAHRKAARSFGSGCACRSASDPDAGSWPGLLILGLVAIRRIRRRSPGHRSWSTR